MMTYVDHTRKLFRMSPQIKNMVLNKKVRVG